MQKLNRMFEVIQILRAAGKPMTGAALAERLEVSQRTVYRDIAALQSMHIPIEGEAGVGYIMRRGYDLPPLNFDGEEVEALRVGLMLLARTGDSALQQAGRRISAKIDALQKDEDWLVVAPWGVPLDDPDKGCVSKAGVRDAIRQSRKLRLTYRNAAEEETVRIVRPLALIYHVEVVMLAAWCELRQGFRHFRMDRVWACEALDETFSDQADSLRALWSEQEGWVAGPI